MNLTNLFSVFHSIPGRADILGALAGWGIYLSYSICYCLAYQVFIESVSADLVDSLVWAATEWGLWLILTPAIYCCLRRVNARSKQVNRANVWLILSLCVGVLTLALAYRVGFHIYFTHSNIITGVVLFFPQYLVALIFVVGAWFLLLKPKVNEHFAGSAEEELINSIPTSTNPSSVATANIVALSPTPNATNDLVSQPSLSHKMIKEPNGEKESVDNFPVDSLMVQRGKDECLVEISAIDAVSAAGNYVDIYSGENQYILRSTLKSIEARLPRDKFVRTHRSHIVQISAIDRIRVQESGNGEVLLNTGKVLSLSKSYRKLLREQHSL